MRSSDWWNLVLQVSSWTGAGWPSAAPSRPHCWWFWCASCLRRHASYCQRERGVRQRKHCDSCGDQTPPSNGSAPVLKMHVMNRWVHRGWSFRVRHPPDSVLDGEICRCLPAGIQLPLVRYKRPWCLQAAGNRRHADGISADDGHQRHHVLCWEHFWTGTFWGEDSFFHLVCFHLVSFIVLRKTQPDLHVT